MIAWVFMLLSGVLFFVCAGAHLATYFGYDLIETYPHLMWLHVAIFVVFVPALVMCERNNRTQQMVWAAAPKWISGVFYILFIYAFINFVLFMTLNEGGGPERTAEGYALVSHGNVLRPLTEAEYHLFQARELRGFSGHWMLFSAGATMLFSGIVRLQARPELAEAIRAQQQVLKTESTLEADSS